MLAINYVEQDNIARYYGCLLIAPDAMRGGVLVCAHTGYVIMKDNSLYLESYAKRNGFTFERVTSEPSVTDWPAADSLWWVWSMNQLFNLRNKSQNNYKAYLCESQEALYWIHQVNHKPKRKHYYEKCIH